jgi:hypothetical protein
MPRSQTREDVRAASERHGPSLRIPATDRLVPEGNKQAARRSRFTEEQSISTSLCPMFGAKGSGSATHVMHLRHASGDIRHGSKPGAVTGGCGCNPNPCAIRTRNGRGCPIIKDLWAREGPTPVAFPPADDTALASEEAALDAVPQCTWFIDQPVLAWPSLRAWSLCPAHQMA